MTPLAYLRIWLASVRYSAARAMMFRFDFFLWLAVDSAWMVVNLLFIEVLFEHITGLAGWSKPEMILLTGTSMVIMRMFFAFFFTNLVAVDRHLREGTLDFFVAQPGNPLFMVGTRKIEFDSLLNTALAAGIVIWAVRAMDLHPTFAVVALYGYLIFCGLVIHFGIMASLVSLAFWLKRAQGVESGYFGLFEVSKLPRGALRSIMEVVFVYALPAIIVSNVPAETLLGRNGFRLPVAWITAAAVGWFAIAATLFHRGLRRYTSASS